MGVIITDTYSKGNLICQNCFSVIGYFIPMVNIITKSYFWHNSNNKPICNHCGWIKNNKIIDIHPIVLYFKKSKKHNILVFKI